MVVDTDEHPKPGTTSETLAKLRGAFASVSTQRDRKRTLFKATLVGMSKSEATTTCRLLKKQRQACMVIQAEQIEVASR